MQLKDAAQLALKKMPSSEQEALSQVVNISLSHLSTLNGFIYIKISPVLLVQVNSFLTRGVYPI